MQTTLLIMAAGIGSRFGGEIKQLEPVDNNNHIIMDYSIHDAIEAGFNQVIGKRITSICKEDVVAVRESFEEMLEKGIYREVLFSDL